MNLRYLLVFLVLWVLPQFSQSQMLPDTSNPYRVKDTVCIKYQFVPLDTLIYSSISFDSISIDYDTPLKRIREETFQVVCDSISKDNIFHLSIKLIEYKAGEIKGNDKNLLLTETPWLNKTVFLVIDSVCDRRKTFTQDTESFAIAPGSAFQPYLFLPFLRSCKAINETWIVNSHDSVVENGYPVPIIKQFSLMRMQPEIDTLNEKCWSIEYVKTGEGTVNIFDAGYKMKLKSTMNGFGFVRISQEKFIPIHHYATLEQKLLIGFPNGDTKPGIHYITTNCTLQKYLKFDPNSIKIKSKKLRKNKK